MSTISIFSTFFSGVIAPKALLLGAKGSGLGGPEEQEGEAEGEAGEVVVTLVAARGAMSPFPFPLFRAGRMAAEGRVELLGGDFSLLSFGAMMLLMLLLLYATDSLLHSCLSMHQFYLLDHSITHSVVNEG